MESAETSGSTARFARLWRLLGMPLALLLLVGALCSLGHDFGPLVGFAVGGSKWWMPALLAWLYVLGAYGLGTLCSRAWRGADEDSALKLAVGLGLMMSLSHLLGVFGLLNLWAAWTPVLIGLIAVAPSVRGHGALTSNPRPIMWLWLAPLALLFVASASTPGWLWSSEFGGFDALSYHLQLPSEWLTGGQIWPVENNVYSFLPGYMESAFTHVGVMGGGSAGNDGMLGFDGRGLIAAQVLHMLLTLCSAALVARLVVALCARCGVSEDRSLVPAWLAGTLVLATPWVIVVGSLAYNEMAVVALGAGAMIAATQGKLNPWVRGAICGFLVGVACGAKPTALFLVGLPTGVLLVGLASRRDLIALLVSGALVGVLTLSPWLIRNFISTGNPVFPQLAGVLGNGHWSGEQIARYAAGHRFDAGFVERLWLLVLPDPDAGEGARAVQRWRGLSNPQWLLFWAMVPVLGALAVRSSATRRVAVLLTGGLTLGLVSWLMFTHVQSRFLIPLIVPGAALVGVGLACGLGERSRRGLIGLGVAGVLVQTIGSLVLFATQNNGHPNMYLFLSPDDLMGKTWVLDDPAEVPPTVYLNRAMRPDSRTYLLGFSSTLYMLGDVAYHTTWDRGPLGDAVRASPDDPRAWSRALRELGFTHVMVNLGELNRLTESGWYDPDVTPEAVSEWIGVGNRPIRSWADTGVMMLELTTDGTP